MGAIRLYTNRKLIPKEKTLVQSNDHYFNNRVSYMPGEIFDVEPDETITKKELLDKLTLSREEEEYMKIIDGAVLIDRESGGIKTPFGYTNLTELSSGCKTMLNILNPREDADRVVFSLNECSSNVNRLIFDWVSKHKPNQELYITTMEVFDCDGFEFIVNNHTHITDSFELAGFICNNDNRE